jgi:23S rRNA (guanosine2251-2'-O)-methyltransferase
LSKSGRGKIKSTFKGQLRSDKPKAKPIRYSLTDDYKDCSEITLEPGYELIADLHGIEAVLAIRSSDAVKLVLNSNTVHSLSVKYGPALKLAKKLNLSVERASKQSLASLGASTGDFFLVAKIKAQPTLNQFLATLAPIKSYLVLALDHIEDPHNLGALMRSAAAFGAEAVLVPRDRSAPLSPTARKASSGGAEQVHLISVVNLPRALRELKDGGFWVAAAQEGRGTKLSDFRFSVRQVLLLGGEGKGVSEGAAKEVDDWLHIPIIEGAVNSLNVSNAGAVIMQLWAQRALRELEQGQ